MVWLARPAEQPSLPEGQASIIVVVILYFRGGCETMLYRYNCVKHYACCYSSTTENRTHGEPDTTENRNWIFRDSA